MAEKSPDLKIDSEMIHCSICFEIFSSPKVLPCLHTFCQACIQKYVENHFARHCGTAAKSKTFPCPTCREIAVLPYGGASELRHDFRVIQLQDELKEIWSAQSIPETRIRTCQFCHSENNELIATYHCDTCQKYLCNQCASKHQKKQIFSNHKLLQNDKSVPSSDICPKHQTEIMSYYCLACNTGICSICIMTLHDSHEVTDLKIGLKKCQENLSSLHQSMSNRLHQFSNTLDILNKREKQIYEEKAEAKKQLRSRLDELIQSIHSQGEKLVKEVDDSGKPELEKIKRVQQELHVSVIGMKSLTEFSQSCLDKQPSVKTLPAYQNLLSKMDKTLDKSLLQKIEEKADHVNFIPSQSQVRLGRVVTKSQTTEAKETEEKELDEKKSSSFKRTASGFFQKVGGGKQIYAISSFGYHGIEPGEFNSPRDVTFLKKDVIVIADTSNDRLQVCNIDGTVIKIIGQGQVKPWGVVVTPEGKIAVADALSKCIKVFNKDGTVIKKLGRLLCPCGIAINRKGHFVVTDFFSSSVYILDKDGNVVKRFELRDGSDQHVSGASHITIDANDRMIISDISNFCVKIFDRHCKLTHKISLKDGIENPSGICVDHLGNILVADSKEKKVCMFTPSGKFSYNILTSSNNINDPSGLSLSPNGYLAITQAKANQVSVFKLGFNTSPVIHRRRTTKS